MASSAPFEIVIELRNKASGGLGGLIEQASAFATGGFIQKGIEAVSGAVTDFVGGAISEASEWQTQLGQLDAVLTSTGGKAGLTKDAILELNKSLSAGGGFSAAADDAVLQGQNMLLTFTNIGKDVFPDASKAMLDMATKMNGGVTPSAEQLQQQAVQLGKALNDPIKGVGALSRVGVTFTDQQRAQIAAMVEAGDTMGAQKLILSELSSEFGGSATAAMDTFAGKQQLLSEQFNNVKQSLGEALMPILNQFMDWLSSPDVQAGIQALVTAVGQFLVGAFNGLMGVVNALQPVIAAVWGFIESTVIPVAQQVFDTLAKWWTEMQPGIQEAWDAIMSAVRDAWNIIEPLLKTGMQFIQDLWNAVWPGIQQTFSGVWQAIQGILQVGWSIISGIWNTVTSVLKGDWEGAWNAIKGMFEGVWKGVETFLGGVWDTIKGIWNTGTSYLRTIWETVWGGIKGFFEGIWNGITKFVGEAIAIVKNLIDMKVAEIKKNWEIFWQGIQDAFSNAWKFITEELPKKLGEFWDTITGWITNTAKDIWNKVQEIGTSIIDGIKKGIMDAWNGLTGFVGQKLDELGEFMFGWIDGGSPALKYVPHGSSITQGVQKGLVDEWDQFFMPAVGTKLDELHEQTTTKARDHKWRLPGEDIAYALQDGWGGVIGAVSAAIISDLDALWGEVSARAAQIAQLMANVQASGSASSAGTGATNPAFLPPWYPGAGGGNGGNTGGQQVLGTGGIVTRPIRAIVGDGGAEAVIPLDRLERWMGGARGGGPTIYVTVNAPLLANSRQQAAGEIAEMLYDLLQGRS